MNRTFNACGTVVLGAILLAGCAKKPESIAPAYVSPMAYEDYSCDQLAQENARVERALVQASEQQRKARSNDTVGVIFLGLPVSSLSGGNVADQIARLKGEQQTLQQTMIKKNCTSKAEGMMAQDEADEEMVETEYTPLPEGVTPPYEGTRLSEYSESEMEWFCNQDWEKRVSPTTGRTEVNPCHRPEAFE